MKTKEMYEAADGTVFAVAAECERHERLLAEVTEIRDRLPRVELIGAECFQHDPSMVLSVQRDLARLYEREHSGMRDHHTEWARTTEQAAGNSLIGRYMSDDGGPVGRAWARLTCIDQRFREWSQPYWALKADREDGQ